MIYEPTDAEFEILQIIWDLEPVAVRDVFDRIATKKDVGYTTVLKQIQRLTEKGVLTKDDQHGTHLYRAAVKESDVKQQLAGKVLQTAFGGSAMQMMMHALGNDKTKPEELEALKSWLDQQIKSK
jgi:predicted transcriptional regulator